MMSRSLAACLLPVERVAPVKHAKRDCGGDAEVLGCLRKGDAWITSRQYVAMHCASCFGRAACPPSLFRLGVQRPHQPDKPRQPPETGVAECSSLRVSMKRLAGRSEASDPSQSRTN